MKILFTSDAFKKIRGYIHGIDYEISGFGKVEKRDEDLVITDIRIFQQVVSDAHTVLDAQALAQFWDDLIVAGEDIGKWKLWWHSHVNMAALFSQTDFDTIEEFNTEGPEENWMLSVVTNKLGKALARIDIFEPIRCTINDVAWDVEVGDAALEVDIRQEILDKVTIRTHKVTPQDVKNTITFFGKKPPLTEEEKNRLRSLFPNYPLFSPRLPSSTSVVGPEIIDEDGNIIYDPTKPQE